LFFSLAGQIERAELERTGLHLVRPIRQVVEPLQQHRGLLHAYLSGDEAFRAEHGERLTALIRARREQVDATLAAADTTFREYLPALAEDGRWIDLRSEWRDLSAHAHELTAHDALDRQNRLVGRLTALISTAADATHLSVDPYVGTFYLAQMVTQTLPGIVEHMARIRDVGAGVFASRELLRDDKNQLISLNTMAGTGLEAVRETVAGKVLTTMPALKDDLAGPAEQLKIAAESIDTFTQFKILGKLFDSTPVALFAGMTWDRDEDLAAYAVGARDLSLDSGQAIAPGPIGTVFRTLDRYTATLDETIEKRLWTLYQQLALNLLVAGAALVVVIYMLWIMYVAFPIRKLIAATEQVAGGDLEVKLEVDRNDEIGQLARAFNSMTEAVKYMRDNLEGLVAERTVALEAKNALIMESIEYARVIQSSYLRSSKADMAAALDDYFMVWDPRDTVGGDYLFFRRFDDGYFFAVIDCTGHGVPGAFMTLIMVSYLNNLLTVENRHDPAYVLARMNKAVKTALGQYEGEHRDASSQHDSDDGMDAAFGWVDTTQHTLTYAGAKTPLFLLAEGADEVVMLDGERKGVGYVGTPMDFRWQNQTVPLSDGCIVCATTDGLIDQVGAARRMAFGKRRLKELLTENRRIPMVNMAEEVMAELRAWQGAETRRDDVSVFGFRYRHS
jgi:serine phosphatase RsbU (regulator of sigma subunit)